MIAAIEALAFMLFAAAAVAGVVFLYAVMQGSIP